MSRRAFAAACLWLCLAAGCAVHTQAPGPPTGDGGFTNSVGMTFALIEAGEFLMGSPPDERGRDEDEILHPVVISRGFYLQTTEVTQRQWRRVMGGNPSYFYQCGLDCPVEMITWHEARDFVRQLNAMENTDRYRLPTEAEWEYACRAGAQTAAPTGPLYGPGRDPVEVLDEIAWFGDNSVAFYPGAQTCFSPHVNPDDFFNCGPQPTGQKKPNAWGLYDMLGNVREWCSDWYGRYPRGRAVDPQGPESGQIRVFRGGGWEAAVSHCRSAKRDGFSPGGRGFSIGLRVAAFRE